MIRIIMHNNIYEHIEDIAVVRELFNDVSLEYGEENQIPDQCGKSIVVNDLFELIPFEINRDPEYFGGVKCIRSIKMVKWHLTATHGVPSHDHMQPDDYDEVEMGPKLDFKDAILMIMNEMRSNEIDAAFEHLYIKNIAIDEKEHPEEAWPTCMLGNDL